MPDIIPNGTGILLLIEDQTSPGTYLALEGQMDSSLSESVNAIDVSSKDGPAREVVGGRYEADGSVGLIYRPSATAAAQLKEAFRARDLIKFRVSEDGVEVEEADVLLTGHNLDAPDQDRAEVSVDFVLSGEWGEVS
jgi:predicted secreted protein